MRKDPEIKIFREPDVLEIVAFPKGSNEVITLVTRDRTISLLREENGEILQGALFGCECMRVFREWLERPMPEGMKMDARERWKMLRGER